MLSGKTKIALITQTALRRTPDGKKEERLSKRNLEENDQGRNENQREDMTAKNREQ